jgi:DNA polymerase-3 subunit delta
MKFEEILRDLKNKIYKPIYLLHGEEEYFIDVITDFIAENVLDEADREFNQTILYGKDVDAAGIVDTALRYPMMANYQVIIVKEAQVMNDLEDLLDYAKDPVKSTILVLSHKHKTFDARKGLARQIKSSGVVFRSDRLYENQVPAWINRQLKEKGISIEPEAARLLTASVGTDLSKIQNEIGKLVLNLRAGDVINLDLIEENIGISKDFNIFELQKAMGKGDMYRVNLICRHFGANPRSYPFMLTVAMLYRFFAKLLIFHSLKMRAKDTDVAAELSVSPYFVKEYREAANYFNSRKVKEAISLLREYDMKFKGVNNVSATEGELLREMMFRIMY